MRIQSRMDQSGKTLYSLSKESGLPYTTIRDVYTGKTDVMNMTCTTACKLAKALDTTVDELIAPYVHKRESFEWFRSETCHRLKRLGDVDFIVSVLKGTEIQSYFDWEWYPECFYLLAMVDYISRVNNVPLCNLYSKYRNYSLSKTLYPIDALLLDDLTGTDDSKAECKKNCIPEFLHYNIIECGVRDVC